MTPQMTESDVRDAIAYLKAYVDHDHDAMTVLARHGDHEAMLLATTSIFAGHLLHVFRDNKTMISNWLEEILVGRSDIWH